MSIKPIKPIPGDDRLTALPISRPGIWAYYKDEYRSFWTIEEINLSNDRKDYENKLNKNEQRVVDFILAFFSSSDKLVNMNISARFKQEFQIFEIDCFYDFQVMMENIHNEMYSLLLTTIIDDPEKQRLLLNSMTEIPIIKEMTDWIFRCIDSNASIGERLLRMACVEGIFFISAFCIIYWLSDRGLMEGLTASNALISRDESIHTMFSIYMYTLLEPEFQISVDEIHSIFKAAVDIAAKFAQEAIPINLAEMNSSLMTTYIECSADNLLTLLDVPVLYNSRNPFHYMEKINMVNKTNFFERRVMEYSKAKTSDLQNFEVKHNF